MLIALLNSTKAKKSYPCPAWELYSQSALFRGALAYVTGRADVTYVLSAKYGLLSLEQPVVPYERSLMHMPQAERLRWAHGLADGLMARHGESLDGITFEVHAGEAYRHPLEELLTRAGATCTCPVEGLNIGERLAFYSAAHPVGAGPVRKACAEAGAAMQPEPAGQAVSDLRSLLAGLQGQDLATVTGVPFQIADIDAGRVVVVPSSFGRPRPIKWRELADAYAYFVRTRQLTLAEVRTHASKVNPFYVLAILAKLPGAHLTSQNPFKLILTKLPASGGSRA